MTMTDGDVRVLAATIAGSLGLAWGGRVAAGLLGAVANAGSAAGLVFAPMRPPPMILSWLALLVFGNQFAAGVLLKGTRDAWAAHEAGGAADAGRDAGPDLAALDSAPDSALDAPAVPAGGEG